jgi:hypothetical protein
MRIIEFCVGRFECSLDLVCSALMPFRRGASKFLKSFWEQVELTLDNASVFSEMKFALIVGNRLSAAFRPAKLVHFLCSSILF